MSGSTKYLLSENEIPERWYNIQAHMNGEQVGAYNPYRGRIAGPDS